MVAVHQLHVADEDTLSLDPSDHTAFVLVHHALDSGQDVVVLHHQLVKDRRDGRIRLAQYRSGKQQVLTDPVLQQGVHLFELDRAVGEEVGGVHHHGVGVAELAYRRIAGDHRVLTQHLAAEQQHRQVARKHTGERDADTQHDRQRRNRALHALEDDRVDDGDDKGADDRDRRHLAAELLARIGRVGDLQKVRQKAGDMLVGDDPLGGGRAADQPTRCFDVVIYLCRVSGRMRADKFKVALDPQRHQQSARSVQNQRERDDKAVQMVVASDKGGRGEEGHQTLDEAPQIRKRDHGAAVGFEPCQRLKPVDQGVPRDQSQREGQDQVQTAEGERAAGPVGGDCRRACHAFPDSQSEHRDADQQREQQMGKLVLDVLAGGLKDVLLILVAVVVHRAYLLVLGRRVEARRDDRAQYAEELSDPRTLLFLGLRRLFVEVVAHDLFVLLLLRRFGLVPRGDLSESIQQALVRSDHRLGCVIISRDGGVGGFEVFVIFAFDHVGEAARLEIQLIHALLVLVHGDGLHDRVARRGVVGRWLFGGMGSVLRRALSGLLRLRRLGGIEADVDLIDILHIDVAQLLDVYDVLDDVFGDGGVGVELGFELDLGSGDLFGHAELQLTADQLVLGDLLAPCRGFFLQRLLTADFHLFIFCGVDLLHLVVERLWG